MSRSSAYTLALCAAIAAFFIGHPIPSASAGINSAGNAAVVPAAPAPGHAVELALDGGSLGVTVGLRRCAWVSCSSGCRWVGAVTYTDGGAASPATATDSPLAAGALVHPCTIGDQTGFSFYSLTPSVPNVAVDPQ